VQEEDELWDIAPVKDELKQEAPADKHELCMERLVELFTFLTKVLHLTH
jgi:hypothetical protein